jgi:hypothetical protein
MVRMGRSTVSFGRSKISGMKRLVAATLWLFAMWYLGSFVAYMLNVPDLLGPALGITSGVIVGIDPRHRIWTPRVSTDRINSRLKTLHVISQA